MKRRTNQVVSLRVLMGVILAVCPRALAGPTSISGSVATFTGNQSSGIIPGDGWTCPPIYTLNINGLAADILPAAGVNGVKIAYRGANGENGGWGLFGGTDGSPGVSGKSLAVDYSSPVFGIITAGDQAKGIFADSAGGNGGSGGSVGGVVPIGGNGAKGGNGGALTITSNGSIRTKGPDAPGIHAVSDAGNGGAGGSATVGAYAEGGRGGAGGNGAAVTVATEGTISTENANSDGIRAVSGAGEGGNGGEASWGVGAKGGDGGPGGAGGSVVVRNYGYIETKGGFADGIFGKSLGGAGGDGGFGGGLIGVGGGAVAGAPGGTVSVTNAGEIQTSGADARGIFAESVGGFGSSAGGAGGAFSWGGTPNSAGDGGTVTVTNSGSITATGGSAESVGGAVFAHSVGGGGGDAFSSGALVYVLGGSGSAGGDGGGVGVTNHGLLETRGNDTYGIMAQSVGGGGGSGGNSGALLARGGSEKSSGDGGQVGVTNTGAITTKGDGSGGIFAESLGGGGGVVAGHGGSGWSPLASWGGSGESGGNGGEVRVHNSGNVDTSGNEASGIFAQSLGGGGGAGGTANAFAISFAGKKGGDSTLGGHGGQVVVDSSADVSITTKGDSSHGIHAQSLGGGGGAGGDTYSWVLGLDFTGSLAFGGTAGGGGNGGAVTLTNHSTIDTKGEQSHGLIAHSLGGGGGSGGSNLSWIANVGAGVTNAPTITATVTLGGSGGDGGSGSKVAVASTEGISTSGFRSYGLLAQSVGGGGGDGGNSMTGALAFSTDVVVNVTMGGSGGAGGNGGEVDVDSDDMIETEGDFAYGMLAQSIGGGGGAGGNSSLLVVAVDVPTGTNLEDLLPRAVTANIALGGSGATGGAGGSVDVDNTGDIRTKGAFANGILAESIGGGGGAGGDSMEISLTASFNLLPAVGVEVEASVGGFAYTGGDPYAVFAPSRGGSVVVHNSGAILTEGAFANGIVAQSIGGGGGAGGDSTKISADFGLNLAEAFLPSTTYSVGGSVGGFGGEGGAGDGATVDNSGDIITLGHFANGILAQSIGGGGGAGGSSMEVAVDLGPDPTETLLSFMSPQYELSVGGFAGKGGTGGVVTVDNSGNITTAGRFANGILAQSIGGGGGVGGDLTEIDVTWTGGTPPLWDSAGVDRTVSLGGQGGMGGSGGVVTVRNHGDIITTGDFANGILAQSVGGGGGTSGSVTTRSVAMTGENPPATLLKGASAGTGNGRQVIVENDGQIVTHGGFAHGILAQSIGGGGGFGGMDEDGGAGTMDFTAEVIGIFAQGMGYGVGFAGSTGGSGSAGAVSVTHKGSITTYGDMSHGILAQSAAGHDGMAGPVGVTLASSITAHGVNSDGIHAQSMGSHGNGDISIAVGGTVRGGSGLGVGVNFDGGAENTLINYGHISALSGTAVRGSGGDDIIENSGTVTGQVHLGAGVNAFNNNVGARFDTGLAVDLGEGNALTNAGILSPGGLGVIVDTTLIGDLVLSASSVLEIEIGGFAPGPFDSLEVTGAITTAAAGGMGLLSFSSPLGGVHFSFLPDFDPALGLGPGGSAMLEFLTAGSPVDWTMLSYEFSGGPSYLQYSVYGQGGGLFLQANQVVPAPGALLLAGMGLGLLGWGKRRLRR